MKQQFFVEREYLTFKIIRCAIDGCRRHPRMETSGDVYKLCGDCAHEIEQERKKTKTPVLAGA